MPETGLSRTASVIGPYGETLTLDALPDAGLLRWVPRRKAEVLAAVEGGLLTIEEACERYCLSLEEFNAWQISATRGGLKALRATRYMGRRTRR